MDSMINRYTSDLKLRHDDAYTPGNVGGKRPDRAVLVYTQKCREAYKGTPVVIGGIEASLRRIAHYDYWSDKVRRSILMDSKADLLLFGNAERAIIELTHRLAQGEPISSIRDIRGTAWAAHQTDDFFNQNQYQRIDSTRVDIPAANAAKSAVKKNPYHVESDAFCSSKSEEDTQTLTLRPVATKQPSYIELPSFEKVQNDPVLYAHASRVLHLETNPGNARPLLQAHDQRFLWVNPPPIPLTTEEIDWVFDRPYSRTPHPQYGNEKIPAYEMIRFSVNIMRGCFGGCSFCSITEHEGRIIQSRSEDSIIKEIENIRDKTPGFSGTISDLGGPTANMYQLTCKDEKIEANCRRLSCVYPGICKNLNTDHSPTTALYRRARQVKGVKHLMIASGLRYDLAIEDPEYVKELVTHHVGGYLKIAPEHTEQGPLSRMMKPGMGTYYRFKALFDKFSKEAGKKQYLIPYFISAHPGTTDEDMLNLALWLKENGFKADQVQNFYPSPMANATTMYHTKRDPLHRLNYKSDMMSVPKGIRQRRLHKAFLRYHAPENWPLLREALRKMGKAHLIGNGQKHLIPAETAQEKRQQRHSNQSTRQFPRKGMLLTQHTGLPPTGKPKYRRKGKAK
jgi:uncharacterized radical SAM protein YgiQ